MAVAVMAAGISVLLAALIPLMLYPSQTVRWLRRKKYQYDVTIPLYMCTPAERIVINCCLFSLVALICAACFVYLPTHLAIISRRAVYYYSGSVVDVAAHAAMARLNVSSPSFLERALGLVSSASSTAVSVAAVAASSTASASPL